MGGVEAIVQAMQQDLKAANVQAFGASALQSLAMQNQDNVRRCHKRWHTDSTAGTLVATLFLFEKQAVLELLGFTSELLLQTKLES